eukprot:5299025-Amphidinium_carterae.1
MERGSRTESRELRRCLREDSARMCCRSNWKHCFDEETLEGRVGPPWVVESSHRTEVAVSTRTNSVEELELPTPEDEACNTMKGVDIGSKNKRE